jgi:hypothetical protein
VARLPVLGNHDAHADPFHWLHQGLRTRTLFFARTPDAAAFGEAVRKGRVVAVAHGPDGDSIWGHPHWTSRARAERAQWDRGRPPPATGVPDPLAIAIDRGSLAEMPALGAGFGIVVRAAPRLGDDALPAEVRLFIDRDEHPVPLRLAPPRHDGPPVLWAPLPALTPGEHQVRIEAFGRKVSRRLCWGRPVEADTERPKPSVPLPPRVLDFTSVNDFPFVRNTSVTPTDFSGSVNMTCGRADFLVAAGQGGSVEVTLRGGGAAEPLRFYLNGEPVEAPVEATNAGSSRTVSLPVGNHTPPGGVHRLTLRTALTGWVQRPDVSDLFISRVAWEREP